MLDVDAEEVVNRSHVLHRERGVEALDEVLEERRHGCRKYHVVDVEQEVCHLVAVAVHEQGGVRASLFEANRGDEGDEALEPSSWCLTETIERG